jgi:hypothetical protein
MAQSVSWTNQDKLRELLARASGSTAAQNRGHSRYAAGVVSFGSTYGTPVAANTAPIPVVDTASKTKQPDVAKDAPPIDVPKLVHTSDNPSDQLDTLIAWTLKYFPCTGAFIADDNGLTLAAHGISEAHVALVGPLLSSLVSIRSIPDIDGTSGALWLGSSMMSWAETRTERGGFCLGVLSAEAFPSRSLRQLKEALELTVRALY